MINYDTTLVAALKTIGLGVYYELFCDSSISKPCITYMQANDAQDLTGDTLGYSRIQYYIKLWGDDLSVLNPYRLSIDEKMRSLGFDRVSFNQLTADSQICQIMLYEATAYENFNN